MEDTVRLLQMNSDFISYQRFPDKEFFRKFQDHYDRERIGDYSRYLNLRAGINRNLEQFATTSEFIRSVYAFDPQTREVFSLELIPTPIQIFPDREWYSQLPGMAQPGIIGPFLNRNKQLSLYQVFPSSEENGIVFIIDLDLSSLYRFLWKQIEPPNSHQFFILNDQGDPLIYHPQEEQTVHSLAWALNLKEQGLRYVTMDHNTLLVTSYLSRQLGWSFHSINDRTQFSQIFRENRTSMILMLVPLLIILLMMLFLLQRRLYSPINSMVNKINPERIDRNGDELVYLQEWMDRNESERVLQEEILNRALPAYKINFLNRMLDDRQNPGNPEMIREEMAHLDFPLPPDGLRIACFFPDDILHFPLLMEKLSLWCDQYPYGAVPFVKNRLAVVIMDGNGVDYADLCTYLDEFISQISRECLWKVYGVLSPDAFSLHNLPTALKQAEACLRNYLKYPHGTSIKTLGFLLKGSSGPEGLAFPENQLMELTEMLRKGDEQSAITQVDTVFNRMEEDLSAASAGEVQHFYIRILSTLLARLRDQGMNFDYTDEEGQDLFVSLIAQRSFEDIRRWFYAFCRQAAGLRTNLGGDTNAMFYINRAEDLMGQQLGDSISLTSIAEQIGISSFYLSRIFKEEKKESFTDFLTGLRMKKARILLEDPSLKIKIIGEQVGYWSANYFIKVFKKQYGVTPGELRKTLRERK